VRIIARNALGESEPSAEYFVMSGAPHKPADLNVEVRAGGGFDVTWDRPEPYYPNNSDFRPVRNFKTKTPIRDADGNTVPQFRYDVEYRLEGDPAGSWCSQNRFQDVRGRNNNLDPVPHRLKYLKFCEDYEPVMGESYKFRIRAAYVWKISGDTNVRNGPWAYSDALTYDPSGGPPDTPTGIEAVGGKESLLVFWDLPSGGTPADDYLIQWRTGASYESGDNAVSSNPTAGSHLINRLAGHGRYYVRIIARNALGESEPSAEYFVMSGAPHKPADLNVEVRAGGGFDVTWDRPEPYYPNNSDFRPVRNFKTKTPIRDADGNTVPQFRYDVEYRLEGDPAGSWCSQNRFQDVRGRNNNLDPVPHRLKYLKFCEDYEPVMGESYKFRIRAAYVWKISGDTNVRNGPWAYSDALTYDPSGGPPDTPTGIEAVGGKESLLVFWDLPSGGTPADDYLIQWRTGASYESGDNAVSSNPTAGSHLINRLAGHGRYYVRIIARNVLGESEPSDDYFVMSGAPGPLTDFDAQVRSGGGFTVTWDRPDPYYPNNKDYRPVRNFKTKKPKRDADGNTVPQYRYDVEYQRADGQTEGWCSQSKYRDFGVGNDTLNGAALTVDVTEYCSGAEPVDGESYNFRIRASYVWMKSGDTNPRNGPWVYSGPITYGPPIYNQTP
jgi:hypothetical protein